MDGTVLQDYQTKLINAATLQTYEEKEGMVQALG